MTTDPASLQIHIDEARGQISLAQEHFKEGLTALSIAIDQLSKCPDALLNLSVTSLPTPSSSPNYIPSSHRREHRSGRTPVLDQDPVLRAFVLARLDGMTFEQIADDISAHFPEGRRLGKSAIQAWCQKNR